MDSGQSSLFNQSWTKGAVALAIVFSTDCLVPLGVAVGVLYICCIGLLIRSSIRAIIGFSATITGLILLAVYIGFEDITWKAAVNRGISVFAVWLTCLIAIWNKRLDQKIELYTQQLEQKNRELEQFVYIASHDLQEPLRTVSNYSKLIQSRYRENLDDNGLQFLEFMTEACARMRRLIKGLLDYSRLGRDQEFTEVDCNQLLEEVTTDLSSAIEESSATIHQEALPTVRAQETDLRLLFQNLISNSIKFREPSRPLQIFVSAKKEDLAQSAARFWVFRIEDNGMGMDPDHRNRVFKMFQRLHSQETHPGDGIGLAHCKKIAQLHGGDIWVETTENKGTAFFFSIPM